MQRSKIRDAIKTLRDAYSRPNIEALTPAKPSESHVGAETLLYVVEHWGRPVQQLLGSQPPRRPPPDRPAPRPKPPADPEPSEPSVDPDGREPRGPVSLSPGESLIENKHITGAFGVVAENGVQVSKLTVRNCVIEVENAAIYGAPIAECIVSNTIARSNGGANPFSARGTIRRWTSTDSTFDAAKAWRLYGLIAGTSRRDTFTGYRLMCGGGVESEWENPQPFHNFVFADGWIIVDSVELYNDTKNVTFQNMDFTGTGHISIQPGARDIHFVACKRMPEVKFYNEEGDEYQPDAQELADRGITGV